MNSQEAKLISLFFYFALLDQAKAIESSSRALQIFQKKLKRNSGFDEGTLLVSSTKEVWDKINRGLYRGRGLTNADSGWTLPHDTDLGPWRMFQKSALADELEVVIWTRILRIREEQVAEGLGISMGTVRYRCARALQKLGEKTIMSPNSNMNLRN